MSSLMQSCFLLHRNYTPCVWDVEKHSLLHCHSIKGSLCGKRRGRHFAFNCRSQGGPSATEGFFDDKSRENKQSFVLQHKIPIEATYLKKLKIKDFVLVKNEEIEFDPGFNVITGESGAGKSILIEALSQVLGKTSLGDCIRSNCYEACLEGVFHLSPAASELAQSLFRQYDLPNKAFSNFKTDIGGNIVLKREIVQTVSGLRSRCYVNSVSTSARVLRAFADLFFDVNGQHSVTRLGDKQTQLNLIDQIAQLSKAKSRLQKIYGQMTALRSQLASTYEYEDKGMREKAEELCSVVNSEQIMPGEEIDLRYLLQVLETHASSVEMAAVIAASLTGDNSNEGIAHALHGVVNQVKTLIRQEQRNAELSDTEEDSQCEDSVSCALYQMDTALQYLENAETEIHKAVQNVQEFATILNFDAVEQSELRQRLRKVEKLLKDFDCASTKELLDVAMETEERLQQYYDSDQKRSAWEEELAVVEHEYITKSIEISLKRREAAGMLRKTIEDCLYDLAMKTSRFDVRINWDVCKSKTNNNVYVHTELATKAGEIGDECYDASIFGLDSVEFLLASGPTEPLRSLSGIASGGECARIMLAFKAAPTLIKDGLGQKQLPVNENVSASVLVLDELDTGVGGRLGETVGRLLKRICTSNSIAKNQAICVSHLPQVAVFASNHIKATKIINEDGTIEIKFNILKEQREKAAEINEMMGKSFSEMEMGKSKFVLDLGTGGSVSALLQNSETSV